MKSTSFSKVLFSAVIGFAAGISTQAMGDVYGETHVSTTAEGLRMTTVSYADLDLSDPDGKEILNRRLRNAAADVCGSPDIRKAGSIRQAHENKSCSHHAVANAEQQAASSQVVVVSR